MPQNAHVANAAEDRVADSNVHFPNLVLEQRVLLNVSFPVSDYQAAFTSAQERAAIIEEYLSCSRLHFD
jgi:hypothetical protein